MNNMPKDTTIEGVIEDFMNTICPCKWIITTPEHRKKDCPHYNYSIDKDFLRTALSAQKEEIENNIVKMKKTDLDLSPGFSITAEYRLGEIRGWNDAIESIISSITSNKEKK